MSTTEAEYLAASAAGREAVWLRMFLKQIGFAQEMPTSIVSDNQSSLKLIRNPVHHARTKHIQTHHHFIRDLVHSQELKFSYISTDLNMADVFTKALPFAKFSFCRERLGVSKLH